MVGLACFLTALFLSASIAHAQRTVDPNDLILTVTPEEMRHVPYQQEMILLTIHGVYKRHITLEKLEMPALTGLNWMQLGQDHWYESFVDGKAVKNMRRRVAIFPEEAGTITIGPFLHHLTLLDENNGWFEHTISSEPVTLEVRPAPKTDGWWFPVRQLQVADDWSNAPDQLQPGEGVLRIVKVSALGASPAMIPPMPELTSPSALIFAHPEKRLVDLTSQGPVAIAYWRWTITPRNSVSAILEPVEFEYFDTVQREIRTVSISPQRVAFLNSAAPAPTPTNAAEPVKIRTGIILASGGGAMLLSLMVLTGRNRVLSTSGVQTWWRRQGLLRQMRHHGRRGDMIGVKRAATSLGRMSEPCPRRAEFLKAVDGEIYGSRSSGLTAAAAAQQLHSTF